MDDGVRGESTHPPTPQLPRGWGGGGVTTPVSVRPSPPLPSLLPPSRLPSDQVVPLPVRVSDSQRLSLVCTPLPVLLELEPTSTPRPLVTPRSRYPTGSPTDQPPRDNLLNDVATPRRGGDWSQPLTSPEGSRSPCREGSVRWDLRGRPQPQTQRSRPQTCRRRDVSDSGLDRGLLHWNPCRGTS